MARMGLICAVLAVCLWHTIEGIPNLNDTSQEAVVVFGGEEAFIDCKVQNLDNYTVLFKYVNPELNSDNSEILFAGEIKITSDQRFSILHHQEHEIWVLKIKNAKSSDSGIYICETNSNPKQQMARLLSVIDSESTEAESGKTDDGLSEFQHNYTDCCINEEVPDMCHGFCQLSGLVNNQIPSSTVHSCLPHLPSITKCLNGGRNNMNCCRRQNIPNPCLSVCVGNFTLSTVTDHFVCMDYAAPMLACIAEGIQTLPPPPEDVIVEPVSSSELTVKWFNPEKTAIASTDAYHINVTQLHTFDDLQDNKKINNLSIKDNTRSAPNGLQKTFIVNASLNEYTISDLKPFTMYEIQMTAVNKLGSSLSTNPIRALTLTPEPDVQKMPSNPKNEPKLPNIRKCCQDNGVVLDRCLDTLCDPTQADTASLSDLMICAPWANVTFKCMALDANEEQFTDHSNCCQQRGVSSVCLSLCKGNVKRIDFRHFICLDHMSTYTNCILSHHKVLTSEPQDFRVSNVHHTWAVLKWKPPKKLANTVLKYHVHWRETSSDSPSVYQMDISPRSPHLIDNLKPGYRYEAFVAAVNKYGMSQGSVRVIFSTPRLAAPEEVELEQTNNGYNETACCVRAGLSKKCMPLCSYKVKVADVFNLSSSCMSSLSTLVRCGTGGRNHVPCCRRRDVSAQCLNVCAGLTDSSSFVVATRCSQDFGKIIQCMEEGSDLLPGMPIGLHANFITKNSVHLQWKPALEDVDASHISYQVRYGKTDNSIPLHPLEHTNILNATKTRAIVEGLEPNTHYSIYITAHNVYGVSLPSLVLLVKTMNENESDQRGVVHARLGPPHSLELIHQTVESITLKWLPPLYAPTDAIISYIAYYKAINGTAVSSKIPSKDTWYSVMTPYTTVYLTNLTYNTEYALAIQAISDRNETSTSSEIVLVWTDPAIPAAVQMPLVIPAGPVIEGSNITVMCISMGTPVPFTSMFINGMLIAKQESRHLAFTIVNVNRNLTSISCFAINGEGKDSHSAQSSVDIYVRFKPTSVGVPQVSSVPIGGTARLFCTISANPQPRVYWYRQQTTDLIQLHPNQNISLVTVPHSETPMTYIFTLIIKGISKEDAGNYMCTTENDYGKAVVPLTLGVTEEYVKPRNTSNCCREQGVSEECLSVCELDIDIEAALLKPKCFAELDKLMNCAADGSDHRQCCRRRQVPNGCLRWCAGLKVTIPSLCILSSSREIISCFQEGKSLLPGPPTKVHVTEFVDESTVKIEWTPPDKNPELVQWYRVFWRPVGSRDLMRNQTEKSSFELQNLDSSKMYEFVVKSGNHYGLSVFTDPLVVNLKSVSSHSTSLGNKFLKVFLGIAVGIVLILAGVMAIIYYYKYHHIPKQTQTRGVSFENPTYLKDSNTIQINDSRVSEYVSETTLPANGESKNESHT